MMLIGFDNIDNFSLAQNNLNNTLGYYDDYEEDDEVLNDNEQAALVPMEGQGDKVLCLKCNKILGSMFSAKRHFISRHQQSQKSRCQLCQKLYKNVNSRDAHMIIAHGISSRMMKNAVTMPSQGNSQQ